MKQINEKYVYGIYGHDVKTKNLEISNLHGFKGHLFKVEYDRHLFELAESIRENGKPVLRSDELLARQAGESRNQIAYPADKPHLQNS